METINNSVFEKSLRALRFDIYGAELTNVDPEIVPLAKQLMEFGKQLDIQRTNESVSGKFNNTIERDFENPSSYTNEAVIGQPWSDGTTDPLEVHEEWNRFRRASNTGIKYELDEDGLPVNPFFNYGVKGRGIVGRFGPNHAVDMGPCRIMRNTNGDLALHVLGIVREDSGLPALCGGFTTFEKYQNGVYGYSKRALYLSQTHEFFEELVSGSVELLPEYAEGLEKEIEREISYRNSVHEKPISERQQKIIERELTTQRKLLQVEQEDPAFLQNVYSAFANAKECYAGPVMSSSRNTNTSWMETKLSWFMLDEQKWEEIKGDSKFDYDFVAGDDAQDVLWHEVTPELIEHSGNHGSLFCYLISSYLCSPTKKDPEIVAAVKNQAKTLLGQTVQPSFTPETLKL